MKSKVYSYSFIRKSFVMCLLCIVPTIVMAQDFETVWETTTDNETITIPTTGTGYDYTIDWGDGTTAEMNVMGDASHEYAMAGTYTVAISGDFPRIYFNNTGDKEKILEVSAWGTNPWTSMEGAFYGCVNLEITAADSPDLSGVTSMSSMLHDVILLNQDIGMWDVSTIEDMTNLFANDSIFNQDIGGWITTALMTTEGMFSSAKDFNQDIGAWDVSSVATMTNMFANAETFNQDISGWTVTNVTLMDGMFANAFDFNQALPLWDVSNVTSMSGMFANATSFNSDITGWTVTAVTDMSGMFGGATVFNQNLNGWDVTMVQDMNTMFAGAAAFNMPLDSWIVTSVSDFSFMFAGAAAFNQDISMWMTTNALDMNNFFAGASTFNQDLSTWQVGTVTTMERMFSGAGDFDQDLSTWDVSMVNNMTDMFGGVGLSIANYDSLLQGWSAQTLQNNVNFNAGSSRFCAGESDKDDIINTYNWNIQDGGLEDIPPVPDLATLATLTDQCEVVLVAPTATDACTGVITGTTTATSPYSVPGTTMISWEYDDGNGNTTIQMQEITINDVTAPTITCVGDITANSDIGQCGAIVNFTPPVGSDNCDDFTISSNFAPGDFFPVGTTTVQYTVTDAGGNTNASPCNFTITVMDAELPTISNCPSDVTISITGNSCDALATWTPPTANDNCSTSLSSSANSGDTFPIGSTMVTYTATDAAGNTANCSFMVNIVDDQFPAITNCPSDIFVSNGSGGCDASASWTPPSISDNCTFSSTSSHNPGDIFPLGTTTVIYSATDASGNVSDCSFDVTVEDSISPVIGGCPFDIVTTSDLGSCGAIISYAEPVINDNCTTPTVVQSHASGDFFPIGTTTVLYTATDASGNMATCTFDVTVSDTEAPTFTDCPGEISFSTSPGSCEATVTWTPPTANDNCGTLVTSTHTPGDVFPIGSTVVTYNVMDPSGNITECSFQVNVEDTVAPVISDCPANISLTNTMGDCSSVAVWTEPSFVDDCPVTFTATHNSGDSFPIGVTTVAYTYNDASGNESICTFTVTVTDTENPAIVCQPITVFLDGSGEVTIDATDVDNGTTDNCGIATLELDITVFDCGMLGENTVTMLATDVNGNIASCQSIVTVVDNLAPVLSCPQDMVIDPGGGGFTIPDYIGDGQATALDNCVNPIPSFTQTPPAGTVVSNGVYTILFTAIDTQGNEANCTFELTIDNTLGIEPLASSLSDLILFPNPAKDYVIVSNPQQYPVSSMILYDLMGRKIKEITVEAPFSEYKIAMTDLASGNYLLLLRDGDQQLTKRIHKK